MSQSTCHFLTRLMSFGSFFVGAVFFMRSIATQAHAQQCAAAGRPCQCCALERCPTTGTNHSPLEGEQANKERSDAESRGGKLLIYALNRRAALRGMSPGAQSRLPSA